MRPNNLIILRLIWFSMIVSLGIYTFVVFFISNAHKESVTPFDASIALHTPLLLGLLIVAVAMVAVSFAIPGFFRKAASGTAANTDAVRRGAAVAQFAMIEGAAVVGVAAALIDQHWQVFAPFLVLSLGGFLAAYPAAEHDAGSEPAGTIRYDG
jgi:hypothetical protein